MNRLSDAQLVDMVTPDDMDWKFIPPDKKKSFGFITLGNTGSIQSLVDNLFDGVKVYARHEYEKMHASVEIPIIVGMFYGDSASTYNHYRFLDETLEFSKQKPCIVYWVGTDVMNLYAADEVVSE